MNALICTVGTTINADNDIVDALIEEIKVLQPAQTVFIVSGESRANAERIALATGLADGTYRLEQLASPHNLNEIFKHTNEAIRQLKAMGFASSQISVNYTSGTKVMGSGAVLSAVFHQCEELRYIYEAGEQKNQVVLTRPRAVLAYRDLILGQRLIMEMRFQSARDVLGRIDSSMLAPHDIDVLVALKNVADAYYNWDNFRHHDVVALLRDLPVKDELLASFTITEDVVVALTEIAVNLESGVYSPFVFADMYNNALRRRREGRLNDATARVYRTLEMLAQWVLRRYDIDTNDLETRRVPPRYRVHFEAMRSMEDGQVRIGMRKSFELLALLESPLGIKWKENAVLHEMLQCRGRSILAHGTHPILEKDCDRLLEVTRDLLCSEILEFTDLCTQIQFPWLR